MRVHSSWLQGPRLRKRLATQREATGLHLCETKLQEASEGNTAGPHFLPRRLWLLPAGTATTDRGVQREPKPKRFPGADPGTGPFPPVPTTTKPAAPRSAGPRGAATAPGETARAAEGALSPRSPRESHPVGPRPARVPRRRRAGGTVPRPPWQHRELSPAGPGGRGPGRSPAPTCRGANGRRGGRGFRGGACARHV